jgi:cytochrome c
LREFSGDHPVWTPELLDRFLADPMTVVPGTDMSFQGLDDPAQRRILIDWLAGPDAATD